MFQTFFLTLFSKVQLSLTHFLLLITIHSFNIHKILKWVSFFFLYLGPISLPKTQSIIYIFFYFSFLFLVIYCGSSSLFFCLVNILKRLRQCLYGKGSSSGFCLGKWTLFVAFSLKPSLKKKDSSSFTLLNASLISICSSLHSSLQNRVSLLQKIKTFINNPLITPKN